MGLQRIHRRRSSRPPGRAGVVLVETALVCSVFAVFMAGIIEFGHAYLVIGSISAAARGGARMGTVEGKTTADIRTEVNRILGASFKNSGVVVRIKDASVFDQAGVQPGSVNYAGLPDVEVNSLEAGDLFLVRIEVPYDNVALMPPFWAKAITLRSQSVVRHE